MGLPGSRHAKRIALEILGWLLVAAGIAALVLPGPGLVMLALGLVLLSQQYEWAARRVEPVRRKALETASDGVQTVPRILLSAAGCLTILGVGIAFGLKPTAPEWWPLADKWFLPGGWATGSSLILSAAIAAGLLVWSIRRFRGPDADRVEDHTRDDLAGDETR